MCPGSRVGLCGRLDGSFPFCSLLEVDEVLIADGGRFGILLGGGMLVSVAADVVRLMAVRLAVEMGGLRDMIPRGSCSLVKRELTRDDDISREDAHCKVERHSTFASVCLHHLRLSLPASLPG